MWCYILSLPQIGVLLFNYEHNFIRHYTTGLVSSLIVKLHMCLFAMHYISVISGPSEKASREKSIIIGEVDRSNYFETYSV